MPRASRPPIEPKAPAVPEAKPPVIELQASAPTEPKTPAPADEPIAELPSEELEPAEREVAANGAQARTAELEQRRPVAAESGSAAPPFDALTPSSLVGVAAPGKLSDEGAEGRGSSKRRAVMLGAVLAAAAVVAMLVRGGDPEPTSTTISNVHAAKVPAAETPAAKAAPAPVVAQPSAPAEPSAPAQPSAVAESGAKEPSAPSESERAAPRTAKADSRWTRVTVRTQPPGAVIYDERQRIGKDVAEIRVLRGQKRKLIALLNLHHPAHIVVDGSVETMEVDLKPMNQKELARATARAQAR